MVRRQGEHEPTRSPAQAGAQDYGHHRSWLLGPRLRGGTGIDLPPTPPRRMIGAGSIRGTMDPGARPETRGMRMLRKGLIALGTVLLLVLIGLAVWEPLVADRHAGPPPHRYDSVVARDRFGVPHVFGRTDADVAYGVGYAHSEDDFATLQEVLAMTRGRLGAITGGDGAKTDYVLHLLGAQATVARDYAAQPADIRALLDGYASGVNAYAARHPGEVKLAKLFPVDGRDVATGFVLRSPFFFGLDKVLGALSANTPLPPESAGPVPDSPDPAAIPPKGDGNQNGSNAFAVAPKRSADGYTRLVSNSHQPWTGQVAWYELVVHSGQGWNFAGATFPGVPFPLLGHNRTLGWTNTGQPARPDRCLQAGVERGGRCVSL